MKIENACCQLNWSPLVMKTIKEIIVVIYRYTEYEKKKEIKSSNPKKLEMSPHSTFFDMKVSLRLLTEQILLVCLAILVLWTYSAVL